MQKAVPARLGQKTLGQRIVSDLKRNKYKYLLIIPVLVFFWFFHYRPLNGLQIAFKNFRPFLGISGSAWADPWYFHFRSWFTDPFFFRVMRNTISISLLTIAFGFPAPIILALLLNELRSNKFKRTVQTITYMPFFISMVVVCALIHIYSQSTGLFTQIMMFFGGEQRNLLMVQRYFYPIWVLSDIWQFVGWNSIIYLAAIAGIDQEQYEAATIDGAHRIQKIFMITLPNLMPIISILFILRMGGILSVNFEKVVLLYNEATYEVADVISTYIFRRGLQFANFSFGAAVGLFNSLINVTFLLTTNFLSKKFSGNSLF
jgi:putative aldouronate transport system permease protein